MFNINEYVTKMELREYTAIHGLPVVPTQKDKIVTHISNTIDYDNIADSEALAIHKSYKPKTMNFGKRLKAHSGQKHKASHGLPCIRHTI